MSNTKSYPNYRDLLLKLHELISRNEGESEQAERLRDQMDGFWSGLDEEDVTQIRLLSWDLYGLNQAARDAAAAARLPGLWLEASSHPFGKDRWIQLLKDLKACEGMFQPGLVYYFKARLWEKLGDEISSLVFLDRSVAADPENVQVRYLFLTQLRRTKPDQALDRATAIIEGQNRHPLLLLKAVELLLEREEMRDTLDRGAYARFVDLFNEAFRGAAAAGVSRVVLSGAYVLAGLCQKRLGSVQEAEDAYTRALELDLRSPVPLVARGILNYGRNTARALDDFRNAIRLEVPLVWPHFFLAHWSLFNSRYAECIDFCREGLKFAKDPDVAANLMHWSAVAHFYDQRDLDRLRAALTRANAIAPQNRWIGAELSAVEGASVERRIADWNLPAQRDVEQIGDAHLEASLAEAALA